MTSLHGGGPAHSFPAGIHSSVRQTSREKGKEDGVDKLWYGVNGGRGQQQVPDQVRAGCWQADFAYLMSTIRL